MEKQQAITQAMNNISERRQKAADDATVRKVEDLICRIEQLSEELRKAKRELVDLQVEPVKPVQIDF